MGLYASRKVERSCQAHASADSIQDLGNRLGINGTVRLRRHGIHRRKTRNALRMNIYTKWATTTVLAMTAAMHSVPADATTLFDSTGLAIQDLAVSAAAYEAWQAGRVAAQTVSL